MYKKDEVEQKKQIPTIKYKFKKLIDLLLESLLNFHRQFSYIRKNMGWGN